MAVLLVLVCWVCTVLYIFGRKILTLYDIVLSLFTHFLPLGPLALIVLALVCIVLICPNRIAD